MGQSSWISKIFNIWKGDKMKFKNNAQRKAVMAKLNSLGTAKLMITKQIPVKLKQNNKFIDGALGKNEFEILMNMKDTEVIETPKIISISKNDKEVVFEKKDIEEKKRPIATLGTSNFGGIAIYDIEYDIDDKVKFRWEFGDDNQKMNTAKIKSTKSGRQYFMSRGNRYYLDEFMRTDI